MSRKYEEKLSVWVNFAVNRAVELSDSLSHEFVQPEHFLYGVLFQPPFQQTFKSNSNAFNLLKERLSLYLHSLEKDPFEHDGNVSFSYQYSEMVNLALQMKASAQSAELTIPQLLKAILLLEESSAAIFLENAIGDEAEFMANLISNYELMSGESGEDSDETDDFESNPDNAFGFAQGSFPTDEEQLGEEWKQLVMCVTDNLDQHNPLIGREAELDRTVQVLCRKEKNNPLHVGEPGVGKTSLVYGLAERIRRGQVPEKLKDCRIYQMEMGQMLAGTQYRGDFEKRLKEVMNGAIREGNVIIYLDEIHNIMGAGATNDGGPDASNILKPYLESGEIRFIGSTTYDEYNKQMARAKGIVRRFQQIDIQEPSVDATIKIIQGLQKNYEKFHRVVYRPESIEFAVKASDKYMSDRFLPDKAIDLIDEAGAYLQLHPTDKKTQYVTKGLIEQILQKVCKIDAVAMKEENNDALKTLYNRIGTKIYGQDEAIRQVVESVQMAKAGLLDDNKPLASLLFVGPTGVGKTEVARVLSQELGIELVRFDMSEYTEKHTVAKLIGSPAGYVGYEDGGLLTDAIRKTPNCVLLLDEIEKAHTDIYNILLQVMDYARLTDNKGQKADFRNVVLIMTSNAGAQYAGRASVGFGGGVGRGEAMLAQVKKTFKPEFINRLSGTVVFRDMDEPMARLILKKKLGQLEEKLEAKKVVMELSKDATNYLLSLGFTPEYGAREMDRVINSRLKPLLMKEILFGKLKKGGKVMVDCEPEESSKESRTDALKGSLVLNVQ
ncbi:AAA family ATPase [Prevotella sp. HUN102]|uniref:AAA family ATPase n=1 Tax=Prevotella sp. HUN102 TaxID=1392486 RepID=UPI000690BDC2|nr:AAA family ATPase [Prevotella sp. HUN102]